MRSMRPFRTVFFAVNRKERLFLRADLDVLDPPPLASPAGLPSAKAESRRRSCSTCTWTAAKGDAP